MLFPTIRCYCEKKHDVCIVQRLKFSTVTTDNGVNFIRCRFHFDQDEINDDDDDNVDAGNDTDDDANTFVTDDANYDAADDDFDDNGDNGAGDVDDAFDIDSAAVVTLVVPGVRTPKVTEITAWRACCSWWQGKNDNSMW